MLSNKENEMQTMGDLRDQWENDNPGSVADTALPQAWADKVFAETGEYPFGFVWGYTKESIFGNPIPLTDDARSLFDRIPENLR
jgi:hypothetical protein